MAEKLKRDYDLIALKVQLIDSLDDDNVHFTLQYKVDGSLTDAQSWTTSTRFIGLSSRLNNRESLHRGPTFQLPPQLLGDLANWFAEETDGTRPLWVHLVKPYGALRLVPWERILMDAVKAPILMLPDFIFPPPLESKDILEIAICGSAPLGHEEHWVVRALSQSIEAIVEAAPRRLRINVFTDRDIAARLPAEPGWPAPKPTAQVVLHDNSGAEKYAYEDPSSRLLDQTGTLRSPWLLWMREALRNRPVDVMHFVCHGYMARDRGAILFAQSPAERTERYLAGPVGATELQTFLTQIGAWSTVFTAVHDNYSDLGLRALGDDIAQSRAGPLMMVWGSVDPELAATAAGYRFLYSPEPEPPPVDPSLFIYCQPYRVRDVTPRAIMEGSTASREQSAFAVTRNIVQTKVAESALEASPLDALFAQGDQVVPWVASTQRFAEQVQLRYQQVARDELMSPERCSHDAKIALDTVDELRRAVATHAQRKGRSEEQA
jgi:hypothetical protein